MISSTYTFLKVKKFTSKYIQNDAPATIAKSEKKIISKSPEMTLPLQFDFEKKNGHLFFGTFKK